VQSYGGHYVPAVSAAILAHNRGRGADAAINLVGIAIGNGLTDPAKQYSLYADFSASKGLIGETLRVSINTARPPPPPEPPAAPARLRRPLRPCAARAVLPHLQRPHPDVQLDFSPLCYLALLVCQQTVVGPIQARPPHRRTGGLRVRELARAGVRASAASARGDSRSRRAAASRMRPPRLVRAAALPGRHRRQHRGGDTRCAAQAAGGNFNVYDVRKARPRRPRAAPGPPWPRTGPDAPAPRAPGVHRPALLRLLAPGRLPGAAGRARGAGRGRPPLAELLARRLQRHVECAPAPVPERA